MPPIINSEHSKITLNTRNVFIDVTATDPTKLAIVVNIVATMFSEYCAEPYTCVTTSGDFTQLLLMLYVSVEPCKVIYPDGKVQITPTLAPRLEIAHRSYVNSCTGLSLSRCESRGYLYLAVR